MTRAVRGLLAIAIVSASTRADAESTAAATTATASCEHRSTKGRVLCDVELETASGRLAWADVVVVEAPPFAPPLRSRIALGEARSRTDTRVRIPVAFVATREGRGKVRFRARAVVCRPLNGAERCTTEVREAPAEIRVGTDIED
jgi:hypothetical protein